MPSFYTTSKLSNNIFETPEGYLICRNAALARAGELLYLSAEVDEIESTTGAVRLTRTIDDLTNEKTLASFNGKPVTIGHPDGDIDVTPDNWCQYAVGVVQNPRRGDGEHSDKLVADLMITDRKAIELIKSGELIELSNGYKGKPIQLSDGYGLQKNIVGNHVAFVKNARCGSECRIYDSLPNSDEYKKMSLKEKLLSAFSKSFDDAMPENVNGDDKKENMTDEEPDFKSMLAALSARLDEIEKKVTAGINSDSEKISDKPMTDECDSMPADESIGLGDRLANIEAALLKLVGLQKTAEESEGEEIEYDETDDSIYMDSETVSRAKILAPNVKKSKNIKIDALNIAYKTEEGKKIIDKALCGKFFDSSDKDQLFLLASELMKSHRNEKIDGAQIRDNAIKITAARPLTPSEINERNKKIYSTN